MKLMDIQTHSDYLESMDTTHLKKWELHRKRVEFGRQPLTLGMFVPINEKGEVLEEPDIKKHFLSKVAFRSSYTRAWKEYSQAKERVLFEGFDASMFLKIEGGWLINSKKHKSVWVLKNKTVEDCVYMNLTLTPNAIKQLGL